MTQEVTDNLQHTDVLQMTTQVVAAYVGHNSVGEAQISDVIKSVYASLAGLNGHSELAAKAKQKPAIAVKKSITADYLICLEDGKKLKMLKRHLRTAYGLSPEDYRAKWGLGSDYPMVAPNYAKQRSAFAKKIGLGKRRAA
jgi:predicted transcriptional regulator